MFINWFWVVLIMKITIIGGAGFIGTNAAEYYAKKGHNVTIFDSLVRKGTTENLRYLSDNYNKINFIQGDIRSQTDVQTRLKPQMANADSILHLAAQVAVTTSVKNPREDFDINALGTFNVLESLREIKQETGKKIPFIYASTNKVYGKMEGHSIMERETQYDYKDMSKGANENEPLDFYSPYGCSKGMGDQYTRDYARMFGLDTVVMRQSCIYGPHQFGIEDQGWLAWFAICNALDKPCTIFGDGKQVRDALYVEDLVEAYDMARQNIDSTRGQIYNLGGGPRNKLSVLDLISNLEKFSEKKMNPEKGDWRPGDQKVFYCDISKAEKDFGWVPKTGLNVGIGKLYNWVKDNKEIIKKFVD